MLPAIVAKIQSMPWSSPTALLLMVGFTTLFVLITVTKKVQISGAMMLLVMENLHAALDHGVSLSLLSGHKQVWILLPM